MAPETRPAAGANGPRTCARRGTATTNLLLDLGGIFRVRDEAADELAVALGEQGEPDAVGLRVLRLHPLPDHLALGVDDLAGTGELELEPDPLAGMLGLEEPCQPDTTRADVTRTRGVGDAADVLVEQDVDLRPPRPALLGHRRGDLPQGSGGSMPPGNDRPLQTCSLDPNGRPGCRSVKKTPGLPGKRRRHISD